jgi:hypothetical protein
MHQTPVSPGVNLLGGSSDPGMKAMVEPYLDEAPAGMLAFDQALYLPGRYTRRLLHEDVRACLERALGEPCELIVNRRYDDDVGIRRE